MGYFDKEREKKSLTFCFSLPAPNPESENWPYIPWPALFQPQGSCLSS